jgi:integrase
MATGKITKRTVDALRASAKAEFLWDDELRGFGLKVTPAGNKVFMVQYRLGGRGSATKRYTIGNYGSPWTPSGARDEAERLLQEVRKGRDPLATKAERNRVVRDLAFTPYSELFMKEYVEREWKASHEDAGAVFRLHVRPILKLKPLPDIRKSDIAALFDSIPRAKAGLRRKIHAILSRMFRWAVGRGDLDRSPMGGVEVPQAPDSRDRWLNDDELRFAWLAAGDLGYPFGPVYRLLIGTGQRREEVAGLGWKELHRATAEWIIPAARAKNGHTTTVPLTAAMIAELDKVSGGEKWPRKGFVFTTTGETPVSGYSRAKSRLDTAMLALARKEAKAAGEDPEHVTIDAWRTHDLRRTFATGMQRLGVRFEVTEAVLNHVSGARAGVAGVYQRHDWKQEKRDALDAWARHVEQVVAGSDKTNVVSLADRRA